MKNLDKDPGLLDQLPIFGDEDRPRLLAAQSRINP